MSPIYIDVGDGTLITPPPATPYVPPAAPPPPIVVPAAQPQVAPTAAQPLPTAGHPLIESEPGILITAPPVVRATPPAPPMTPPTTSGAPEPRTIPQPGHPLIADTDEFGNPILIPAPSVSGSAPAPTTAPTPETVVDPAEGAGSWTHWGQGEPLELYDLDDLDSELFAAIVPLRGAVFVDYVRAGSERRSLDPLAVLAEAYHEGISGGIGDGGDSYGPWQLYKNGRLPRAYRSYPKNSLKVNIWAWSRNGIDYALDGMAATAAKGKRGVEAVTILTRDYEVPAHWEARNLERIRTYEQLSRLGGGAWDFLAKQAAGPAGGGTSAPVPETKPQAPATNMKTWRDLLSVFRDDLPAAGVHMQTVARTLKGRTK